MKKDNKGFSLVELIIVIAIMAVLIGVLAPQFMKYVERGRKSTDVQNVAEIVTALQVYAADPMVAAANKLVNNETITLTTTEKTATEACSENGNAEKALTAAGINKVVLKSSGWSTAQGGAVTLVVNVASNGEVTVAVSGTTPMKTNHDILTGKYE